MATVRFPVSSAADLAPTSRSIVDGSADATPVLVRLAGQVFSTPHRVRVPLDRLAADRFGLAERYTRAFTSVLTPLFVVIFLVVIGGFGYLAGWMGWALAIAFFVALFLIYAVVLGINIKLQTLPYRPRRSGEWVTVSALDPGVAAEWAALNRGVIEVLDR